MNTREYPARPLVAVGGVILQSGRVLLVRRAQEPLMGHWSIPGGAVELGETLQEALRREIQEETGLLVSVGDVVEVLERITTDDQGKVRFHYVLVDYLCRVEGGQLWPATDVSEVCWAHRLKLSAYDLRPETLRVIEKAFAMEHDADSQSAAGGAQPK